MNPIKRWVGPVLAVFLMAHLPLLASGIDDQVMFVSFTAAKGATPVTLDSSTNPAVSVSGILASNKAYDGTSNAVIAAEYSGPARNSNFRTNSPTQTILTHAKVRAPSKLLLTSVGVSGAGAGQLAGTASKTFVVQASSDLITWTTLSTNAVNTNGTISLVDSNAFASLTRYYRTCAP
jgi:hypothetical protein